MPADSNIGRTVEGDHRPPAPVNEPVLDYAPGSTERAELRAQLDQMKAEVVEIPLVIDGEDVFTGNVAEVHMPHDHGAVLARYHMAGPEDTKRAIESCMDARSEWASWNWQDRAAVFLRAADLLAGPWRQTLNASTMLGQGKTCHQAEIDAACESIDFWRPRSYIDVWRKESAQSHPPRSPPSAPSAIPRPAGWSRAEPPRSSQPVS